MSSEWKTLDMKAQMKYMQQLISCLIIWFLWIYWMCIQKSYAQQNEAINLEFFPGLVIISNIMLICYSVRLYTNQVECGWYIDFQDFMVCWVRYSTNSTDEWSTGHKFSSHCLLWPWCFNFQHLIDKLGNEIHANVHMTACQHVELALKISVDPRKQ